MIAFLRKKEVREPLAQAIARKMGRPKRILFVDDSDELRDFFTKLIPAMFAVEIVCVESVASAREVLSLEHFDAAILDYLLTNGSGVQLYDEITRATPEMRVVFLTGYDNSDLRRKVEAIGPARIYSKDSVADILFLEKLFAQFGIRKRAQPLAVHAV